MNGIGPRNFNPNMKADLTKQVKDLGKLDEGKALGEAQQANTDRPEGTTDVDKTVIVTWGEPDSEGWMSVKNVFYDGIDNGVIINKYPDGSWSMELNENDHDRLKESDPENE